MQASDKTKFGDAMAALGVAFATDVGDAMREVYWRLLADLDVGAVLRGCEAAGRTLKWFPKPSEIRELSGQSAQARAAESWEAVRSAMDRHDYTVSVDFGPLVNAIVRNLGGWRWLCDQKLSSLPFVRKDFERVFCLLAASPPESLRGEPLAGAFDGPVVRVSIGSAKPAIGAIETDGRGEVRKLVRSLVDKSP